MEPAAGKFNPGIARVTKAVHRVVMAYACRGNEGESALTKESAFVGDSYVYACIVDEQSMKWRQRGGIPSSRVYRRILRASGKSLLHRSRMWSIYVDAEQRTQNRAPLV